MRIRLLDDLDRLFRLSRWYAVVVEKKVKSNKGEQASKTLVFPGIAVLKNRWICKGGFRTSCLKVLLYARAQIRITGIFVVFTFTETKYAGVQVHCKEHLGNRLPMRLLRPA